MAELRIVNIPNAVAMGFPPCSEVVASRDGGELVEEVHFDPNDVEAFLNASSFLTDSSESSFGRLESIQRPRLFKHFRCAAAQCFEESITNSVPDLDAMGENLLPSSEKPRKVLADDPLHSSVFSAPVRRHMGDTAEAPLGISMWRERMERVPPNKGDDGLGASFLGFPLSLEEEAFETVEE